MKLINKIICLSMIFITFITCFLTLPRVKAGSYDLYVVKYKCPVRSKAGDIYEPLKSGNDTIYVSKNQQVDYLGTYTGPNEGNSNATWYAIRFDYAAREYTGYVAKACMYNLATYTYNDDAAFEESIKDFPESYKPYLRKLHAMHPNWKFVVNKTGLDWENSAEAESQKGMSAISHLYPSLIFKDASNPNGIIVDGTSWYAPAKDAVKYYMDPRNFLNEKNIFMFETLSYNSFQDASVSGILSNSFMNGTFNENGVNKKYSDAFIEAGKTANVSSTHLASRALQEIGTTMSSAVSGTVPGYEGYYNFYNIGAYSGPDNYLKGLQYAKDKGWNSIQKAITGGALEIGSRFINKGQDTMYFQKWNVASYKQYKEYTHQYMTNIMAPVSESSSIYETYKNSGKLSNNYTFTIPVYENMPDKAFKVSRTDTIGGNDPEEKPEEKPEQPVIPPETKVANAGYSLATGYLTNVQYGAGVDTIKNNIVNQNASVAIMNSNWVSKTSGIISTGDIVNVDNANYTVVVYGDPSGDGVITIKDLLLVQKSILGTYNLSGAYKQAADVSKDGQVTIKDLLLIQKNILGTGSISQ